MCGKPQGTREQHVHEAKTAAKSGCPSTLSASFAVPFVALFILALTYRQVAWKGDCTAGGPQYEVAIQAADVHAHLCMYTFQAELGSDYTQSKALNQSACMPLMARMANSHNPQLGKPCTSLLRTPTHGRNHDMIMKCSQMTDVSRKRKKRVTENGPPAGSWHWPSGTRLSVAK